MRHPIAVALALLGGLVGAPAAWATPAEPTAFLGVDEARILSEGGGVLALGLVPTVGVGHGVHLNLARRLGPGELRAHALLAGRAQAVEGAMAGLGYKLPVGRLGPFDWAAMGEFSAGQSAFVATPRMVLGALSLPGTMALGPGALSLTPRLALRDDGLKDAPLRLLQAAGAGLQLGLRWPLGLGLSALGEVGALWQGGQFLPITGALPAPVLRLGLRWAPWPGFTWDLGAGLDPSSGLGTPPGRQEQLGVLSGTFSWGW